MRDCAREIKQAITMRQVCDRFGISVNRANKACCPFHADRTPSMQIYPGDRGYWCYVCNEGGDVIDFTMRLLNLPFKDAMARLNEEFSLRLPLNAPADRWVRRGIAKRKQLADTQKAFELWRLNTIKQLSECFLLAHAAKQRCNSRLWTKSMVDAVKEQARIEDLLNVLDGDDLNEQVEIFRQRKEVREICERILSPLQLK